MPRLRLLADTAIAQASAQAGQDSSGNPIFDVGEGDVAPIVLDATGWAGADSIASSEWESLDGATLSSRALSGAVASCAAYLPDGDESYRVRNTLTLSTGAIRRTTVWLRAQAR